MKRSAPIFSKIPSSGAINNYRYSSDKPSISDNNSNVETNINKFMQTPLSCGSNLIRSTSIPSLKLATEEKRSGSRMTVAKSMESNERTPVTHFCTPRRDKQIKRYFSEVNLDKPPATPDCYANVHMETPRIKTDLDDIAITIGEETSNLTVGIRVRPLSEKESRDPAVISVVSVDGGEVKVACDTGTVHTFTYDHCFWSCDPRDPQFASQEVVFTTMMQPLVDKAFQGYNASLFAYGQTGSGKSYSIMGLDIDSSRHSFSNQVGIIPRFCHELFERIASLDDSSAGCSKSLSETASVEISYFEIYNEKIHDLLAGTLEGGRRPPLKVREHPQFGPYVVDLSVHSVSSYEDLQGWLAVGNSQRATAATGMNEKSSRSHSIFSIILTQTQQERLNDECHELSRRSKINLVDLAGSERVSQTCASGERYREGVSINKSLLTLGKVIAALADISNNNNNKRKVFVPYRESVLTWLLRESLGGNSKTTMLATISPANIHIDETLATLRYACQARTVVNRVRINEDPHARLVRELRAEVERLRLLRVDTEHEIPRLVNHKERDERLEQELVSVREQLKHAEEGVAKNIAELTEALKKAKRNEEAAKKELEIMRSNYEQQIKILENKLTELKSSLDESQRVNSQLEIRNKALETEFQKRLRIEEITTLQLPVQNSNFLQEFEAVLNETVTLDTSQFSSSSDSSLHELSQGVDEANELCKQFQINFNLQRYYTSVKVQDCDKQRVSYWKPSSFFQWLQLLRDCDPNDGFKELLDIESWQEENTELNETFNISSCIDSALETSNATTQQECSVNPEDVNSCVIALESNIYTLRSLCRGSRNEDINNALRSLEADMLLLRGALYKPSKSNLKSPKYTSLAPKAVRFLLSNSQMSE